MLAALFWVGRAIASAQTPTPTPTPGPATTVPSGSTYTTQDSARANGVKIQMQQDGSVWFLEAGADRVGVLRGTTITYWQLRPTGHLGANPVDFEIDGDTIWLIESGESEIPAGTSAFASLNTATGALTEWVVPGSIPAAFYRAPDGKVWIPQTNGRMQSVDLNSLQAVDYRSTGTFAYADMVLGPDGALWLTDFGDNRIVRYVPGATTETSWTFFNPAAARLNPAEMKFDDQGHLWISQFSAGRMDRFDPASGELRSYYTINHPIHFDIFRGLIYVTSGQSQSAVSVLDPGFAIGLAQVLTPQTLDVASSSNARAVTIRTSTIAPTTFESTNSAIAASDLTVASGSFGIMTTAFPSTNTYGIAVAGGFLWIGTDGKLANLVLQSIGGATDQSVPTALSLAGPSNSRIRVDMTLSNRGSAAISGDALYLYSPGAFAARVPFTLAAGATQLLSDAFGSFGGSTQLANGPVRIRIDSGPAADLLASVRSTRVLPGGGTLGYAIPAATAAESLGPGSSTTLFTGARDSEVSILGIYTQGGAAGVLTLSAPDGTVRGTRSFDLAANTSEEFNPAASAFGVAAEPGDVVRGAVTTGSLQAYVSVLDLGSRDVAISLPVATASDAVIPIAGQVVGGGGRSFVSDLFVSNPDPDSAASVSISFYPLGGGTPSVATLDLLPQESRAVSDFLTTLFGIAAGQGALIVESPLPIASAVRIASRTSFGDYGTFAASIHASASVPEGGSAVAIGVPQTASRGTNLLLYNRGAPGTVTVTGFKPDGTTAGSVPLLLGDHEPGRLNYVFAAMGITDQPAGRIRVDAPAGMRVYAWTAEVDGVTGDVEIAPLR